MGRLEGKVAWITGAASGIGLATSERFAAEGAIVVGSDISEGEGWPAVADAAPASGFHLVDVRDAVAQEELVTRIIQEHGRLDVLVTAAGVAGGGHVHTIEVEEWDRVQDINLKGTMLSCRAALKPMVAARSGSIITIASVEGLEGCEGGSTYNASKGGVVLLTKNIASDYGPAGIRANAICPGFIDTPMFQAVIAPLGPIADSIREQHKLKRWGRPSEIAGAAFFLACDDSSFVTGVALPVDGGYTAGHSHGLGSVL
ncbi:SDR family NAD(P)-dependent oxidoreductase [Candidatus Poriferisocius sp.]|uniref:SDR family NAD(P)-dependent oxidoreductase n=1 Tax=Candidatus Poriferisocius sp. TaxID=3101276 RepID=UPI003B01236C